MHLPRRALPIALALITLSHAQENVMRPSMLPGAPATQPHYIALESFDFKALLPPPPEADSLAGRVDLETVLQVQAARTPEQVAWAKLVEKDKVFNHATLLGAWFTAERLPATNQFFSRMGDDLRAIDAAAKKPFLRARPWTLDPRVEPCVAKPTSTCYPSGSALQAFVWAELLAEIFPDQRAALLDRAHRAAWGRVVGGVHFPSDVVAGQLLAPAYLTVARKNPAFREAFEASRQELIKVAAGQRP